MFEQKSDHNAPRVLIVGAGPTGLVLALSLARRGVPFRIIDAASGSGLQSRAMGVQARTLEFYQQFGFADEVVDAGIVADRVHIRRHGADAKQHEAVTFQLSDLGNGISPYPFMLAYPQDDHERFLIGKLAQLGIQVDWNTKLLRFAERSEIVHAVVERAGVSADIACDWLVGCDGASSVVRQSLDVGFPGGTYEQRFYVADVKIAGAFDRDIYVNLGKHSLALMMPVRSRGMQRLIGLVPESLKSNTTVTFADIRDDVEPLLGVSVSEVNWFSTYRVHHRVAAHFRMGRTFLAGDAGHLHSPMGGQGMNTGIGDAINLGWKLADVVRGRVGPAVLDTYESERLPFAQHLVETTDRAFTGMIAQGIQGEALRRWIAPAIINTATRFEATKHLAFRTFSQTAISYLTSALSEGDAGIHSGERLPWIGTTAGASENFEPLQSLDWQVHVYGKPEPGLSQTCEKHAIALHHFAWSERAQHAGFAQNAAYLIRPDGYVGLASASGTSAKIDAYVARVGLALQDK